MGKRLCHKLVVNSWQREWLPGGPIGDSRFPGMGTWRRLTAVTAAGESRAQLMLDKRKLCPCEAAARILHVVIASASLRAWATLFSCCTQQLTWLLGTERTPQKWGRRGEECTERGKVLTFRARCFPGEEARVQPGPEKPGKSSRLCQCLQAAVLEMRSRGTSDSWACSSLSIFEALLALC